MLPFSLSGGPGLGPPAIGESPPGRVGGFQPQQRPHEPLLPLSEAQNSGTMQTLPMLQSGPVHSQAPVGPISPELVCVEMYVTGVVVPELETMMTVLGTGDAEEEDRELEIVIGGEIAKEPAELLVVAKNADVEDTAEVEDSPDFREPVLLLRLELSPVEDDRVDKDEADVVAKVACE